MSVSNIEIIEHTADIGIRVRGDSLSGLFTNAASGMIAMIFGFEQYESIIADNSRKKLSLTVKVQGNELEELLMSFLSELLYLFDGEKFIPLGIKKIVFNDDSLTALVEGVFFDPDAHKVETEIKAVTYHGMSVQKAGEQWVTDVIFDI